MNRLLVRLFATTLVVGTAPPPLAAQAQALAERDSTADAELRSYGAWLLRLQQIQDPVNGGLAALSAAFAASQAGAAPRPGLEQVVQMLARIDASNAQLVALERPEFPALDLPQSERPAALVSETIRLNQGIREVFGGIQELEESASRNPAAADLIEARVLDAISRMYQSQLLVARASLAATPRDEGWEIANFDVLHLRTGQRLFNGLRGLRLGQPDVYLARDMGALADELEINARNGDQRSVAALESTTAAVREAESGGRANEALAIRRETAVLTAYREVFVISRELAAHLRSESQALGGRTPRFEDHVRIGRGYAVLRGRISEVNGRLASAIAQSE